MSSFVHSPSFAPGVAWFWVFLLLRAPAFLRGQNDDHTLQIASRVITMGNTLSTGHFPVEVCWLQTHFKSVHKHSLEAASAKKPRSGGAVAPERPVTTNGLLVQFMRLRSCVLPSLHMDLVPNGSL